MLPNTKKLSDKWWKFFEGMLLVYPIAGLLVGAGDYISRLLLSTSTGFFTGLTAMIIGIVPIFFIPMVLKSTFSAMGKIGGTLAGMGTKASSTAKSQVRARGGDIAKKVGSTDTFRSVRNAAAMKFPLSTKRMRARAVQDQAALKKEQSMRNRLSDRSTMRTRLDSITAAEEAKAVSEATAQRLSLMQNEGINVTDENGTVLGNKAYNVANAEERMKKLEEYSRKRPLSKQEHQELAALASGMSNMSGGGGAMARIIRQAQDESGNVNNEFMSTMGEIISRDSNVQSKLNEKDAGVAAYTEKFVPGEGGYNGTFDQYKSDSGSDYGTQVNKRIKTHEAGLNQSTAAAEEYLQGLSKEELQAIRDDDKLYNSLENDIRRKFDNYAKIGKTAQVVGRGVYKSGANRAEMLEMSDGSLRDARTGNPVTNPNSWKKQLK